MGAKGMGDAAWGRERSHMRERRGPSRLILALGILAGLIFVPAHSASALSIKDLGTVGGDQAEAMDINYRGQIVGWSHSKMGDARPFLWKSGTMKALTGIGTGIAYGINRYGQIVGRDDTDSRWGGDWGAFSWKGGKATIITDLGFEPWSAAHGINNNGQVVGTTWEMEDCKGDRSFAWKNGSVLHWWHYPGPFYERGGCGPTSHEINIDGYVVGSFYPPAPNDGPTYERAFIAQIGDPTLHEIGTLGGLESAANALNNNEQVVGKAQTTSGTWHAFLWQNGVMHDLGTLGGANSEATDINDKGQIVGWSETPNNGGRKAFLWQNGSMTSLGTLSGGRASAANAINHLGHVVGWSHNSAGLQRAVAWR